MTSKEDETRSRHDAHADEALAEYLRRVGRSAEVAGQADRAERYYKAAQLVDRWCVLAVYNRAMLYDQTGREDEAAELWRSIVDAPVPGSLRAEAARSLADRAARAGQHADARALYTRAIETDATDADAATQGRLRADGLTGLAGLAHLEGRLDDAEGLYRQAVEADPWAVAASVNLAEVLSHSGRLSEAVDLLVRSVQTQTESIEFWSALADCREAAGDADGATTARESAAALGSEQAR